MLSSFNSEEKLFTALQNGASGYILKTDCFKFLENAIEQVQSGGMLFSPEMAKKVLSYFRPNVDTQFNLTKREKEVLLLLQQGMIKKEIAHRLNISYHTVDSHVKNIYKKLHVNSNVQAIRRASENLN
jgi:DNA-binding NarL/FixJ family response regulator